MTEQTMSVISLTVGLMSLSASVVFFFLARKSERTSRETLDSINKAIQEWQSKIMGSAIEMLESRTEIIAKRTMFEDSKMKYSFWNNMSDSIKYMVEHPVQGEDARAQVAIIQLLLKGFMDITKSSVPPEVLASFLAQQLKTNQDKVDQTQDQPTENQP